MVSFGSAGKKTSVCAEEDILTPEKFVQLEGQYGVPQCRQIACGPQHSFAMTINGEIWAWGDNTDFQSGCGKSAAKWLEHPELLLSVANSVYLATGSTQSFAVLMSGKILAWGNASRGALGAGKSSRNFAETPVEVPEQEFEMESEESFSFQNVDRNEFCENQVINLIKEVGEFMHKIQVGTNKSFGDLQEMLRLEDPECLYERIQDFEDDLVKVLTENYEFITTELKECEKRITEEMHEIENQILRTLYCGGLCQGEQDYRVSATEISRSLDNFREILFILQTQPSYLGHLAPCILTDEDKQTFISFVKSIYWDPSSQRHTSLLYSLMRVIARGEIVEATNLLNLFSPDFSLLVHLFGVLGIRSLQTSRMGKFLLSSTSPTSFMRDVEQQKLSSLNSSSGILSLWMKLITDMEFTPETLYLISHCQSLITGRPVLLRQKLGLAPMDKSTEAPEFKIFFPLGRLLLEGFLGMILKDPLKHISELKFEAPNDPVSIDLTIRNLWLFITEGFENFFENYSNKVELQSSFIIVLVTLANKIQNQISNDKSYYLDVSLTMSLYHSHLSTDRRIGTISLQYGVITRLVQLFKKFAAYTTLSTFDPLRIEIDEIYRKNGNIFQRNNEDWKKKYGNFNVISKFLLTEQNLVFCSISHAPIPQRLALRQQALAVDRKQVVSLFRRLVPPDQNDPRRILEEALRKSPDITSNTFLELSEEFLKLQEFEARKKNPDFSLVSLLEEAAEKCLKFRQHETPKVDYINWVCLEIKKRAEHYLYLRFVQKETHKISEAQRIYELNSENEVFYLHRMKEEFDFTPAHSPEKESSLGFNSGPCRCKEVKDSTKWKSFREYSMPDAGSKIQMGIVGIPGPGFFCLRAVPGRRKWIVEIAAVGSEKRENCILWRRAYFCAEISVTKI
eukprot:GHVP01015343.1.p1 GENE.GHVP01015343.1~~GHVP01015343.1.p1  ORF type:complete len:909 (+),score=169.60 GHVP01015343.1:707-3433(+)